MSLYAGFEYIDGEWEIGDPGIGPEEDWLISIADLTLCFITIHTDSGNKEYFFGASPTMVFGADPSDVPDNDIDVFYDFFTTRYPDAEDGIKQFVDKYRVMSTDTEPTYHTPDQAGDALLAEWCTTLNLPNPMENN